MTCDEFKETAAAFVLGALDEEERRACLDHLRTEGQHSGCPTALAEAREVAVQLAAATVPAARLPPPGLWRAIEARVGVSATTAGRIDRTARRRAVRELTAWFIAAAVLGLYLYTGRLDTRRNAIAEEPRGGPAGTPPALRAAIDLLGRPATRVFAFHPAAGHTGRASVIIGGGGGTGTDGTSGQAAVVMIGEGLAVDGARRLRLWAERGPGVLAPVGDLPDGDGDVASVALDGQLPTRLLVTLDDRGAGRPGEVLMTADLNR